MVTDVAERESWHLILPDRGCSLHSECLTCPFERCRYDTAQGFRHGVPNAPPQDIALYAPDLTAGELAARLGVSRRTLMRWRALARETAAT